MLDSLISLITSFMRVDWTYTSDCVSTNRRWYKRRVIVTLKRVDTTTLLVEVYTRLHVSHPAPSYRFFYKQESTLQDTEALELKAAIDRSRQRAEAYIQELEELDADGYGLIY